MTVYVSREISSQNLNKKLYYINYATSQPFFTFSLKFKKKCFNDRKTQSGWESLKECKLNFLTIYLRSP